VLARNYDLMVNILRAEVTEHGGTLIMDLSGKESEIERALAYLREQGVDIRGLERTVVRDRDKCTDCSMCISVCPVNAYRLDRNTWVVELDQDKCIACGVCADACPAGALSLARIQSGT